MVNDTKKASTLKREEQKKRVFTKWIKFLAANFTASKFADGLFANYGRPTTKSLYNW